MRLRCFRKKASSRSTALCAARLLPALSRKWRSARMTFGDAARVVAQDMAVSLEPAGIDGMVGRRAEVLAAVPEVGGLGLGREALQEGPVVGSAISDGDYGDIGPWPDGYARPRLRVAPSAWACRSPACGRSRGS